MAAHLTTRVGDRAVGAAPLRFTPKISTFLKFSPLRFASFNFAFFRSASTHLVLALITQPLMVVDTGLTPASATRSEATAHTATKDLLKRFIHKTVTQEIFTDQRLLGGIHGTQPTETNEENQGLVSIRVVPRHIWCHPDVPRRKENVRIP